MSRVKLEERDCFLSVGGQFGRVFTVYIDNALHKQVPAVGKYGSKSTLIKERRNIPHNPVCIFDDEIWVAAHKLGR